MLDRAHRIVSGDDYRRVVRHGKRVSGPNSVVYLTRAGNTRFGFIVSKSVGNAVVRNRVRRRLKAIAASILKSASAQGDIVIRALPGSAEVSWVTLNSEITAAMDRGRTRV